MPWDTPGSLLASDNQFANYRLATATPGSLLADNVFTRDKINDYNRRSNEFYAGYDPGLQYGFLLSDGRGFNGLGDGEEEIEGIYESAPEGATRPVSTTPGWLDSLIDFGTNVGSSVLKARYGQPNINPGTYLQQGPSGTIAYRAPEGAGGFFSAIGGGANVGANVNAGISTTTLIVGAVGLGLVFMLMNRR